MTCKLLFLRRGDFPFALFRKIGFLTLLAALAAAGLLAPPAQAVPYASAVVNNAGTVSFILNEAADNVTIVFDGGASTTDMGALAKGSHSFSIGAAATFEIRVRKVTPLTWTQISTDSQLLRFSFPRGVAVNQNPGTPAFGRIYVSNSRVGTTLAANGSRPCGDGIYLLNADGTDALGRGNTESTGGLTFAGGNAVEDPETPFRIEVGQDNNLYIGGFGTNFGSIYRVNQDADNGELVLAGIGLANGGTVHGLIGGSPIARGSLAGGDLKIWSTDGNLAGNLNRLMRWDINSGPLPSSVVPAQVAVPSPLLGANAHVTTDNELAPDGKFIVMQNRANGTEVGVAVLDAAGTTKLWDSLVTSRAISNNPSASDILRTARGVKVSSSGRTLAVVRDDGQTWILPLTNGIPDMNRRLLVPTMPIANTGRDVGFDAVGNLYVVSSGAELLRVWSPGGDTLATTRSDGTFGFVEVLPPDISVAVSDSLGSEEGTDAATFTVTRTGGTTGPLTVNYTLTGTATNGTDYVTNELSVTIPINESSAVVTITPIDDTQAEPVETVILTLVPSTNYVITTAAPFTAYIADNELPVLSITSTRPSVEESFVQYGPEFVITRLGDTNTEIFVNLDLTADSVAAESSDVNFFNHSILMPGGVIRITNSLQLLPDQTVEGDELLGMFIAPSFEYTVGTPGSAYTTIRDDDYSAECVLFSDDFNVDSSANWSQLFGANNGILDRTVTFNYDYSARGIPSAPHSGGGTLGLFLQVNKNEGSTAIGGGSAGVNLYPLMQSFGGNYALRFDLYLSMGSAGTTEHALAGLNHSGTLTNRVTQSTNAITTAGGDGVFVAIETDGSNNRDWTLYTYPTPTSQPATNINRGAGTLTNQLSAPPYAFAGSPGNSTTLAYNYHAWSCIELAQSNGVISLRANRHLIYSFTNTSGFTSGNIMLGMNDQFDSVGSADNYAIIDNVRVVNLNPAPIITSINIVGGNIQIDFNAPCSVLGDLHLQSTTSLTPPIMWEDDETALLEPNGSGFRFIAFPDGDTRYYRIRR